MSLPGDDRDVEQTKRADRAPRAGDLADEPGLAEVVAALRAFADEPAPRPTPELARVLRDGVVPEPIALDTRRNARPMVRRAVVSAAFGVKIALAGAAAAAALTGAATLEPVPEAIREPARDLVEQVTGVLPWVTDDDAEPADDDEPADDARSGAGEAATEEAPGHGGDVPGLNPRGEVPGLGDEHRATPTPTPGGPAAPPADPPGNQPTDPGRPEDAGQGRGPGSGKDVGRPDNPGRPSEAPGQPAGDHPYPPAVPGR